MIPPLTPRRLPLAIAAALTALGTAQAQTPATMETIVVSASGFEQEIRQAPASITVLTREELETKSFNSIADALKGVEGVDVGDSAGKTGGLDISIRGMPSDYTLVLIDGRRQNVAGNVTPNGFGETSTSFLPPVSAIERIEVIRGPMSTLYGSDAMGGVINIITRKVAREWTGQVSLEGTLQEEKKFGNSAGTGVYLSGPIKQDLLGLVVRGGTFHRSAGDISYDNTDGEEVVLRQGANPTKFVRTNVGARLSLTPNRNNDIYVDVDSQRQTYDNTAENFLGTPDTPTRIGGYADKQRFNRQQYVLAHTGRYGIGVLESSLTQNNTETIGRTIPTGTPGKEPGSDRTLEMRATIFDTKLMTPFSLAGDHLMSIGAQWQKGKMIDGVAADPFEFKQWALFVEDEWRIVDSFALTAGVRYDHHSEFGGHTSPRIYGVWDVNPSWTVKGGVSRGYKTPRLDQLADGITGFVAQGTRPTIGTPSLKPETSTSTELGVAYDNLNGFSASGTIFNNDFRDKIASGPGVPNCSWDLEPDRPGCVDYGYWPGVDLFAQSVNVDKAVTRGLELNTRIPLAETWSLRANYTYTWSEQKSGVSAGQPLTNTPRHMFNAGLHWQPNQQWAGWLRTELRSSRYRGAGEAYDALGDYKGYALFHLGGSYRVNNNITINATIYNLFNKDFVDYVPYTTASGVTNYANRYNNNQDGRRLWVSTQITF
ncbi:MAG: TonB-dependent receptor [Pigmentiphaga sp.]